MSSSRKSLKRSKMPLNPKKLWLLYFLTNSSCLIQVWIPSSLLMLRQSYGDTTFQFGTVTNIAGAQQWQDEIGAALQRCDWFAVIISPQSVGSMWVKRELAFALQQNRFEKKIVPILYQPSQFEPLSWTLSLFQIVDFTRSFDEGCRDLLRIWGIGFRQ